MDILSVAAAIHLAVVSTLSTEIFFMANEVSVQSLNDTWINDVAFWTSGSFKSGSSSSCSWLTGFLWLLHVSNWLSLSLDAFDWSESLFPFGLFFFNLNFPCLQQMMNSKEQRNTRVNRTFRELDLLQTIFTILATKFFNHHCKTFYVIWSTLLLKYCWEDSKIKFPRKISGKVILS